MPALLGETHGLTHMKKDVGERHSVSVLGRSGCSYGRAKSVDKSEEPLVVREATMVGNFNY